MQTQFSAAQLADPQVAHSEKIVRKCVHCGFCTATCPTYVTLGNELDSPRGRIYLIKEMLENDRPADAKTVTHIDRCLSCLACMTTCPADVNYMHLVDHARAHIHKTYRRPLADRAIRGILAMTLPHPTRFRASLGVARFGRPLAGMFDKLPGLQPLAAMLRLAPASLPRRSKVNEPAVHAPAGKVKQRVALLSGCAQSVLDPKINEATVRLLNRLGVEVVVPQGEGCCGALVHHMGMEDAAHGFAKRNVDAWLRAAETGGLDAIVITASGCGTTIKDYGHMLRLDPDYAEKAARVSALAKDVTEFLAEIDLPEPANCDRPDRGLPLRLLDAARSANHASAEGRCLSASRLCGARRAGRDICAAARLAPTTSLSRRSQQGCAIVRSRTSRLRSRKRSPPAISAA